MEKIQVKLSNGLAYLYFNKNKTHHTVEVVEGSLFADYDKNDRLVGIEIINDCEGEIWQTLKKINNH